jgi:hypothetical protein
MSPGVICFWGLSGIAIATTENISLQLLNHKLISFRTRKTAPASQPLPRSEHPEFAHNASSFYNQPPRVRSRHPDTPCATKHLPRYRAAEVIYIRHLHKILTLSASESSRRCGVPRRSACYVHHRSCEFPSPGSSSARWDACMAFGPVPGGTTSIRTGGLGRYYLFR